jgi:hypothetical protein
MFRKIISYLMTGDTSSHAEELSDQTYGPHGVEGEYGLGASTAFASAGSFADNGICSYKIDFSER